MTPPLFHFLIFLLEFAKYILRPYLYIVYRSHKEYAKDENNTNETIWVFYLSILFEYSIWVFYYKSSQTNARRKNQRVLLCIFDLFYCIIPFIIVAYQVLCASSWIYLMMQLWNNRYIVVFTVVILWYNCSPRQLFKFLLSLYHQMHECFEGPLMSKYLRTSSIQGFERLWIWGNSLHPPSEKKVFFANVLASAIFYKNKIYPMHFHF